MSRTVNNLNQRGCAFSLVLNDSSADYFKSSRNVYATFHGSLKSIVFIAVIFHGMDYLEDEGRYKTPHYHVVIECDKVTRVETFLNKVVELFNCNKNQVSIEKCNSVVSQVRYLVHLDDEDKYPYKEEDIVTNNEKRVHDCMLAIRVITSVDDLFNIMRQYPSLENLIKVIGLENYRKYRCVIQDIRKEKFY